MTCGIPDSIYTQKDTWQRTNDLWHPIQRSASVNSRIPFPKCEQTRSLSLAVWPKATEFRENENYLCYFRLACPEHFDTKPLPARHSRRDARHCPLSRICHDFAPLVAPALLSAGRIGWRYSPLPRPDT